MNSVHIKTRPEYTTQESTVQITVYFLTCCYAIDYKNKWYESHPILRQFDRLTTGPLRTGEEVQGRGPASTRPMDKSGEAGPPRLVFDCVEGKAGEEFRIVTGITASLEFPLT